MKMKSSKVFTVLIVLLLIANIITITMLWQQKNAPQKGVMHPDAPKNLIIKELALSKEQVQQYEGLISEHRKALGTLRKELMKEKEHLFTLVADENTNTDTLSVEAQKTAGIYAQMDMVTVQHFKQLRAICNPSQQAQLDKMIMGIARMMNEEKPPKNR